MTTLDRALHRAVTQVDWWAVGGYTSVGVGGLLLCSAAAAGGLTYYFGT